MAIFSNRTGILRPEVLDVFTFNFLCHLSAHSIQPLHLTPSIQSSSILPSGISAINTYLTQGGGTPKRHRTHATQPNSNSKLKLPSHKNTNNRTPSPTKTVQKKRSIHHIPHTTQTASPTMAILVYRKRTRGADDVSASMMSKGEPPVLAS